MIQQGKYANSIGVTPQQGQSIASKQTLPSTQQLFQRFFSSNGNSSSNDKSNQDDGVAVGIDLGTTNSVIAICESSNTAKIIENSEGSRTTPSVVGMFKAKGSGLIERLCGQPARNQCTTNPKNTFMSVKRLIGRQYNDPIVKKIQQMVGYEIVKGNNGDAWVYCPEENKKYSPSQIGSFILQKLRQSAEDYVGDKVTSAVITVPAYFDQQQRQATKDAGEIAGLKVERVVNEPTAAALAYGLGKNSSGSTDVDKTVAVYDLGGGTFDISILSLSDGVFEVLATNGDTALGGDNFDEILLNHVAKEFEKEQGINLLNDPLALQRLKDMCEKTRKVLDGQVEDKISCPFITSNDDGPKHLDMTITRSQLEKMMRGLIEKTMKPCQDCIQDAGINKSDITDVVLVGGMTRMPQVQQNVENFFGKKPNKSVNPDEVVAAGAAIQAGIQAGKVGDVVVCDVIPLSLGIETMGGVFTRMIERNTKIPLKKSEVYSTASDNQSMVQIKVGQGEREMFADNKLLGNFDLVGIPPARRGTPQIEVIFDIDANGLMNVSAVDKKTGKSHSVKIETSGGLGKDDIERMVREAQENEKQDKERKDMAEVRNSADTLVWKAEGYLDDTNTNDYKIDDQLKNEIKDAISDVKSNKDNCSSKNDVDRLKQSIDKLNNTLKKIGDQVYGSGQDNQQQQQQNDSNQQNGNQQNEKPF